VSGSRPHTSSATPGSPAAGTVSGDGVNGGNNMKRLKNLHPHVTDIVVMDGDNNPGINTFRSIGSITCSQKLRK